MMSGIWKMYQCTKCFGKYAIKDEPGQSVPRVKRPNCPYGCVATSEGDLVSTLFVGEVTIDTVK